MKGTVSDRTLIVYTKDICVFKEFLGVEGINTKLRLLPIDRFRSFGDKHVADGCSPTTVNNRLGILSISLRAANGEGLISSNPADIKALTKVQPGRKPFTRDEVQRMLSCATGDMFRLPSVSFYPALLRMERVV